MNTLYLEKHSFFLRSFFTYLTLSHLIFEL